MKLGEVATLQRGHRAALALGEVLGATVAAAAMASLADRDAPAIEVVLAAAQAELGDHLAVKLDKPAVGALATSPWGSAAAGAF